MYLERKTDQEKAEINKKKRLYAKEADRNKAESRILTEERVTRVTRMAYSPSLWLMAITEESVLKKTRLSNNMSVCMELSVSV